jgi:hypothetical protein
MDRRINLCTAVLVGLCMLPVPGALAQAPLAPDQYEPNDTQAQAYNLDVLQDTSLKSIQANFADQADGSDWYKIALATSTSSCLDRIFKVALVGTPGSLYEVTITGVEEASSAGTYLATGNGYVSVDWYYDCVSGKLPFNIQVRRAPGNSANETYILRLRVEQQGVGSMGDELKGYNPPRVIGISPSIAPSGKIIDIAGSNFSDVKSVVFKNSANQPLFAEFTIASPTRITAIIPAGVATGVRVANGSGSHEFPRFAVSSTGDTSSTPPPSKKGGISPVSPGKKQSPSVKSGTTHAPSSKIPTAKAPKKRKDPTSSCVGLGCGEDSPSCIGLGCGETEPKCIGMGCEKKGAVNPKESGPTGTATLPSVKKPTIYGATPCCSITTIAGGLVTAQDSVSGKTFQFHATDQALVKSLHVGQKVYANLGTRQVSVDGAAPCCAIVSAASSPTGAARIP